MFSAELKERTRHVHADLEKKLVMHIKNVKSSADYARLLSLMYGFYFPMQEKLQPFLDAQDFSGHRRGRQAEHILNDIGHIYPAGNQSPPLSEDLPAINSYSTSLGALYVLEGSTLGGKIITGMIASRLNISPDKGFSFFNAYGEQTNDMWNNFKLLLDKPWSGEEKQEITDSATATFATFKNWIIHYESTAH